MSIHDERISSPWKSYYGPNYGYVLEQYELYLQDPNSVDSSVRELFVRFGEPPSEFSDDSLSASTSSASGARVPVANKNLQLDNNMIQKVVAAHQLMLNIRRYGHLGADINPLNLSPAADTKLLEPKTFGLSKQDLEAIPASLIWNNAPSTIANGWEAILRLREIYARSAAYEFTHIHDENEREWLFKQAESGSFPAPLSNREKESLLERLLQVEMFENFIHKTFVGQKRFSIEGLDMLLNVIIVHKARLFKEASIKLKLAS